jgi:hypothetical protein
MHGKREAKIRLRDRGDGATKSFGNGGGGVAGHFNGDKGALMVVYIEAGGI